MIPFRSYNKPIFSVPTALLLLSIVLAPLATAQPACPKLTEKLAAGEPATVVCFGDSVTGLYYHTGGRRAYTDMVQIGLLQAFPNATVTAINAGISGNTTVDALARIEKDVLAHKPDLVTIMFGLNDMTRVPLEDYRANLKNIVAQCRGVGAEVLLCSPNNVTDTESRPTEKLLDYVAVVRDFAAEEKTALADCYAAFEAVRNADAMEWKFLMSDEIHPNMAGHMRIAETIVNTVTGTSIHLDQIPAPAPMIPHTLALVESKQPIKILAMPPYDVALPKVLQELAPDSEITMTTWATEGKSLADFEADAKTVRNAPPDLIFIAVPADAPSPDFDDFKRHFTWTMNWSLSFGRQEWDVVAVPPSFTGLIEKPQSIQDSWQKRLIRAQDFDVLEGDSGTLEERLRKWLDTQRD